MEKMISRRSFCTAVCISGAALALSACTASSGPASAAPPGSTPIVYPIAPEDYPTVDGSTACIPLMAAMEHALTGRDLTEIQTGISVSTTGFAWQRIISDYEPPRMLLVYEAPEYIQQEVADSSVELEVTPIGRDALVFMVNEQNPVKSLTHQQLLDIYTGKITNWKEVGGEDLEITAFQRSEDSGSQTLFKKLVMQGTEPMQAPTELAPADMGGLVDSLAAYNNSGSAIGFSVYYYIDQMYSKPGLRLIAIEGIQPDNDTIASQSYPFCNDFFTVFRASEPADSPVRVASTWLQSPEGKDCIRQNGYVPAE